MIVSGHTTVDIEAFFSESRLRIDSHLQQVVPQASSRLTEAMHYSLFNGGKRIRPILTYASAMALGNLSSMVDTAAAAVECIHAYSLIHDDLPAMDNDDLRRGKPTCHIAFDEATAILAGDALQCLAFELLSQANAKNAISLIKTLSQASGARGMALGQAIDLEAVNQQLSLSELENMHRHKTGALIEASVIMGAITTDQLNPSTETALRRYGQAVGLAFQVQDDILDVTGTTSTLGKRQGADASLNKPTYVTLLGLEQARQRVEELHQHALNALSNMDERADYLRAISAYIVQRIH